MLLTFYKNTIVRQYTYIAGLLLCALFPMSAYALVQPIADPGQILLEEQKRRQEEETMEKPTMTIDSSIALTRPASNRKKRCFNIDVIRLKGATIFSQNTQEAMIAPYLHSCMGMDDIDKLSQDITRQYTAKGYVTTRITIPQQNLKQGLLELIIVEGKVEEIAINNNQTATQKAEVATAFPNMKGKILNLKDVEQGLEQINRLPSNNATVTIVPGNTNGTSQILVDNTPKNTFRGTVGYDNYGQKDTGVSRFHAGIEKDNLIGINDTVAVNYTATSKTNAVALSASVPYGYWTLSYDGSYSQYSELVDNNIAALTGQAYNNNLTLNRVIYRDSNNKVSLETILNHSDETRNINDTALTPAELTVIRLGALDLLHTGNTVWNFDAHYSQGLSSLGAIHDADNLPTDAPRAQFKKIDGSISLSQPLSFATFHSTVHGQYSFDSLYNNEQLTLGDVTTVRGFTDNLVTGDSGLYNQNELDFPLSSSLAAGVPFHLGHNLQPYMYLDEGYTTSFVNHQYTTLVGSGVGVRLNTNKFIGDLSLAVPIYASNPEEKDNYGAYVSVSYKVF